MTTDWTNWQPGERATLLFVIQNSQILLIRKKRGLGAGKINGPGGRIEPDETALQAAIRETREELGIDALSPELFGELHFQFVDGYSLLCSVYVSRRFTGVPVETEEAIPLWTSLSAIPYHEMWEDDIHWLPGMLEGKKFRGFFDFDGDKMLTNSVVWYEV